MGTAADKNWIEVRESSIHNKGVYATRTIPKRTKIIQYVGDKIPHDVVDDMVNDVQKTVYFFTLNENYLIDGASNGNDARFINHSCNPNCEVRIRKGKIWIYALKEIHEGEELSYDYNFDLEDYQHYPCRCGSPNCRGYIIGEEYHKTLKKLRK